MKFFNCLGLNFIIKIINQALNYQCLQLNISILNEAQTQMVEERKDPNKIKSEELILRFRSKEDLYKYLT